MPSNFEAVISIFCDSAALSPSFGTWQQQLEDDKVFGAFGLHPHNAKYYTDSVEERIVECLKHPKAVAWGETGLDFNKNNSEQDVQMKVFARQLKKAVEVQKPIVVHSRDAEEETYKLLKQNVPADWKIHLHCFNESAAHAKRMMTDFPNLFIGFTGAITFPSASQSRDIIRDVVPIERILLETDGPYMAPLPFPKGTVAHCGHIPTIANQIAEIKGIKLDQVLAAARDNTRKMYSI